MVQVSQAGGSGGAVRGAGPQARPPPTFPEFGYRPYHQLHHTILPIALTHSLRPPPSRHPLSNLEIFAIAFARPVVPPIHPLSHPPPPLPPPPPALTPPPSPIPVSPASLHIFFFSKAHRRSFPPYSQYSPPPA